jgi:hypothetical protein
MDDKRIDRLLRREDFIEPSAAFTAAVMDAVRSEAAGRDLLRFPWRLAGPGLAGAGLCAAASAVGLLYSPADSAPAASGPDLVERLLVSAVDLGTSPAMAWVALSCVLTLLTVHLSMRLTQPSLAPRGPAWTGHRTQDRPI